MDLWIRFVGLMLFYQATAGGPFTVILPKSDAGDHFCQTDIIPHLPYIKIATGRTGNENVIDDSKWPKTEDCNPDQHCALYQIPDDSALTIEPGMPLPSDHPQALPCLIPDFKGEHLLSHPKLHSEALNKRSSVTFTPPDGTYLAEQLDNTMIVMALRVPLPRGAGDSNIHIKARPRSGSGAEQELVVRPGTAITILNQPHDHAVMAEDTAPASSEEQAVLEAHFFFLHKLFDLPSVDSDCRFIPNTNGAQSNCTGTRTRRVPPGVTSTKALGCGPGTFCGGC